MSLWLFVGFILVSASAIMYVALGPLKKAQNARVVLSIAIVQYLCAFALIIARVTGNA